MPAGLGYTRKQSLTKVTDEYSTQYSFSQNKLKQSDKVSETNLKTVTTPTIGEHLVKKKR